MTLTDAIRLFRANARRLHSAFALDRDRILADVEHALGHLPVDALRPIDLLQWITKHDQWKSDWTIKTAIAVAKRPLNWCADVGVIALNPWRCVRHQAGGRRRPMTDTEYRKLLGNSPAYFRRVLVFMRDTGCRTGELCALRWEHVDLGAALIAMTKHKTGHATQAPRIIALCPVVIKLLQRIRASRTIETEADHVFLNGIGLPFSRHVLAHRLRRIRKRAGISDEVTLYTLRHRFATKALRNGVDLKTVSTMLGHTSVRMTEHYLHYAGSEHLKKAIALAVK